MDWFLWLTDDEALLRVVVFVCVFGWLWVGRDGHYKRERVTPERTPDASR